MPVARIVGGHNADPQACPWMVSLSRANSDDLHEAHFCGATLVHPQWVATAAHCLAGIPMNRLTGIDPRIQFTAREADAIFRVTSIGSPNTGPYTLTVSSP